MQISTQQLIELNWKLISSVSSKDLGVIFVKVIRLLEALTEQGHTCSYYKENKQDYNHNTNKLLPSIAHCAFKSIKKIISHQEASSIPYLEEIALIIGIDPTNFLHSNLDDKELENKLLQAVKNERTR